MANDRRKSGKIEDRISKIAYGIGIAFILYIVWPLRSQITDLNHSIDKLQETQSEQLEKIFLFSQQCKDDINKSRQDYTKQINNVTDHLNDVKDKLLAMITKAIE